MSKWVYGFGGAASEGDTGMRNLLGGKGANLAEMARLKLPVPPGFTITTEVCTWFNDHDRSYPEALNDQVASALGDIEETTGAGFGNPDNPLLVSVRSGARASMPGMMDTVLNLGLNDATVAGLAARSGDPRFAFDSYRRFIQMYSDVVLGVDHYHFEELLELAKESRGVDLDTELSADDLQSLTEHYKAKVRSDLGSDFPQDPMVQLWGAIGAVFDSWMNQRAIVYRNLHGIPAAWGTAVNVQAMVFGNMGEDCATGVAFTRDPSTGENLFYGEFLINAQGEDVVAGIRTPQQLTIAGKQAQGSDLAAMEEAMPTVFAQLCEVRDRLEAHYHDMQDIEFTVQQGQLYMLQTRAGKRTTSAALKIAVDMVAEGLISEAEAVCRINPSALDQLLHPTLDPHAARDVLSRGLPASPGAASGQVVFTADEAEARAQAGDKVVLVRIETSPEDIHGMHAAEGILTTRGGMTSHAAVVARGMGRPCVSGAGSIRVDMQKGCFFVADRTINGGDWVTIDGTTGEVMAGQVPTVKPELSGDFSTVMAWADKLRRLRVRSNAETPSDAQTARDFGAEGIGLCRTEHMFFEGERIVAMREMILATDLAGRRAALAKILPMQRQDFSDLFKIMAGLPVTIRLLDPPLHEFLPHGEAEMADVAAAAGVDPEAVRHRVLELHESNPMLGHRGCRLAISYPEICEMQSRAIFEAVVAVSAGSAEPVVPEIMIPLAASKREIDILKAVIDQTAVEVARESGQKIDYLIGTMIELPRAALRAGDIAASAEFFSFGTNDLTQTTYGISRDDIGSFVHTYEAQGIFEQDPFVSLDQEGVGELIEIASDRGKATRPDIKLGICGEHGGDPASVAFCHRAGLDYVSCSPFRVPIARLAAAQAAAQETND